MCLGGAEQNLLRPSSVDPSAVYFHCITYRDDSKWQHRNRANSNRWRSNTTLDQKKINK